MPVRRRFPAPPCPSAALQEHLGCEKVNLKKINEERKARKENRDVKILIKINEERQERKQGRKQGWMDGRKEGRKKGRKDGWIELDGWN